MPNKSEFFPDWVSPPGETIADILAELNLSMREFAKRTGQTVPEANRLLEGKAPITDTMARQLATVLGGSPAFWINRDKQYRGHIERLHDEREWLGELPVRDMLAFGWIRNPAKPGRRITPFLQFFDVPNLAVWRERYANVRGLAAFRTSPTFESDAAVVAAWLREGEIRGEAIECAPYDAGKFKASLGDARRLTRLSDPSRFLPRLEQLCAAAGVALVVVRAPSGCRASGAARFLSSSKALLLLSFRYRSDDHFWFTFFHEAGHLLLHADTTFFVDGVEQADSPEEREADHFAETLLIPEQCRNEFDKLRANWKTITRFALDAGISPGIVVGQLQYQGRVKHDRLNFLKRRYTWKD